MEQILGSCFHENVKEPTRIEHEKNSASWPIHVRSVSVCETCLEFPTIKTILFRLCRRLMMMFLSMLMMTMMLVVTSEIIKLICVMGFHSSRTMRWRGTLSSFYVQGKMAGEM